MAPEKEGTSVEKSRTAPEPDDPRKPSSPPELKRPSWKYLGTKALHEFSRDQCTDIAAALTYFAVLSIFPALLALVSLLGVFGQGESTTQAMLDMLGGVAPEETVQQLRGPIDTMTQTRAAGFALVTGLLGALWSASGYVGAFGRAMNRIYEIDEGRPFWKLRPIHLLLTLVILILVGLVMVGLVVTGPVADTLGNALGIGGTAQTVFSIVKWPLILGLVIVIVALLYYATPNVKQPKFKWVSFGAVVAILVWILASALFGLYVRNFGSYNKTYGALAGVIVFLLWLWITNLALLFGAEVDSEMERARQLQSGINAEETLQLPPRDDRGSLKKAKKHEAKVEEGRQLRVDAERRGDDLDG